MNAPIYKQKPIGSVAGSIRRQLGIIFESRAEAEAQHIPPSVNSFIVVQGDLVLFYQADVAGTALETADGRTWSPAGGDIYAEHFGSDGDGDVAKATANINALEAAIAFAASQFAAGGGTVRFIGRHCINRPLVISQNRIFLKGFGPGVGVSRSEIRGIHQYGPVIRWKGDMPGGEDFIVSASSSRRTATRVTKDNFAGLGLTRDDMNRKHPAKAAGQAA